MRGEAVIRTAVETGLPAGSLAPPINLGNAPLISTSRETRYMPRRVALASLLIVLGATAALGQEWARKMFETTEHDFGSVACYAKAEHEFRLKNIYMEDVHIASVSSSCRCTTPRIEKEWLKTYERGAIVARLNTDSFRGSRGATLTVRIDKPFSARVQLHVKGYIHGEIKVEPGSVDLGTVEYGSPIARTVRLSRSGRSDWKIDEVKSANPYLETELSEARRSSWSVEYELTVRLAENAPAGYINDHLQLVTNDYRGREFPVLVEGRVLPPVTVSPSALFMGVVETGDTVTKRLVIRGKKPFRILSIRCDDRSFEFGEYRTDVARPVHVVPVTFVAGKGTVAGKIAQMIRIETDLSDSAPELSAYAVVTAP